MMAEFCLHMTGKRIKAYLIKNGMRDSFFRELTVSCGACIIRLRTSWDTALTRHGVVTVWYDIPLGPSAPSPASPVINIIKQS